MIRIVFLPEAKAEFEDARRYYEAQVEGLGERFVTEVRAALQRLRSWPAACPRESRDIRRMVLSRFPYKLLYAVEEECVVILAVAHQHRSPDYWRSRREP